MYKIKQTLPVKYLNILKSYLSDRYFSVSLNNKTSSLLPMLSGVPQGSILGSFLYTLYTADLPQSNKTILSTFADDTAIFTTDPDPTQTSANLQEHLIEIITWTRKWKLKINESKSSHISFALRQGQCSPVQINQTNIPQTDTVKYLGIHFDKRLTWKDHVQTKRKKLGHKTREIKWIIGRHSPLSLENKIIIYKTVLKPVWTYGIELWGCASNSNIEIIQRYQSKILRILTNAPWYVTNHTPHSDLRIPYVREFFQERIAIHRSTMAPLLHLPPNRHLKRRWTLDGTH